MKNPRKEPAEIMTPDQWFRLMIILFLVMVLLPVVIFGAVILIFG